MTDQETTTARISEDESKVLFGGPAIDNTHLSRLWGLASFPVKMSIRTENGVTETTVRRLEAIDRLWARSIELSAEMQDLRQSVDEALGGVANELAEHVRSEHELTRQSITKVREGQVSLNDNMQALSQNAAERAEDHHAELKTVVFWSAALSLGAAILGAWGVWRSYQESQPPIIFEPSRDEAIRMAHDMGHFPPPPPMGATQVAQQQAAQATQQALADQVGRLSESITNLDRKVSASGLLTAKMIKSLKKDGEDEEAILSNGNAELFG